MIDRANSHAQTKPSPVPLANSARQVRNKGRSIPDGDSDDLVAVRPVWPPGMGNTTFSMGKGKVESGRTSFIMLIV
jgi:hypothetical protein